jgi:hypothetical protein
VHHCSGAISLACIRAVKLGANGCLRIQADILMLGGNDRTGNNAEDQPMNDLLASFYDSEML